MDKLLLSIVASPIDKYKIVGDIKPDSVADVAIAVKTDNKRSFLKRKLTGTKASQGENKVPTTNSLKVED